tara:strand:- start:19522 stop:19743 length:222 start_codon:yes stop_codon:yes gene_type:complete
MVKGTGETFEIEFTEGWVNNGDLLDFGERNQNLKLQVKSEPRIKNNKWWQKLINFVTFGKCYQRSWFYIVERV